MAESATPSSPEKKTRSLAERVTPLLSLASLAVGLLLTAGNVVLFLYKLDEERQQDRALAPRFEYSFFEIEQSDLLYYEILSRAGERGPIRNYDIFDAPVVETPVFERYAEGDALTADTLPFLAQLNFGEVTEENAPRYVLHVLAIKNVGGRTATQLRFECKQAVSTPETLLWLLAPSDFDYIEENGTPCTVDLPDLATGEGVLVPLLFQAHLAPDPEIMAHEFIVGPVLAPIALTFFEPIADEAGRAEIREMRNSAVSVRAGIRERG